jgi:NitT/TauT family transport system substrate-binding protein
MVKRDIRTPFLMFASAILILGASCLEGCGNKSGSNSSNPPKVLLRQEWFPNSNYAGALFASQQFGSAHNIEIVIEPGSDQIDPVQLVVQGHDTFGDASADKVLAANEKGANLVIVAVVSYNSPTVFLAKQETGIKTPKDFEGKTVGILTGTNTEYVYKMLVAKLGLNRSKIKEVEAPFELNTFVTANAYDVRPAYIYDEPVSLDLQNIKYTLIEPKNYGVSFIGTVYFTKRETIQKDREMVQNFVSAVADGWTAALRYPESAISLLKKYDNTIDEKRELLSLRKGIPYFQGKGNKILWADQDDWLEMVKSLRALGVLKNDFDYSTSVDTSFLQSYYASHPPESK